MKGVVQIADCVHENKTDSPAKSRRCNEMRFTYIDNIRIFLTVLVIFHHTAIAFGASGDWYYHSNIQAQGIGQLLLSLQMAIDQSYFMSFFFFISALFMPTSLDRKGFSTFIKNRLLRLGLPLLLFVVILDPSLNYIIHISKGWTTASYFSFIVKRLADYVSPGPLWFVLTLLIFEFTYVAYRKLLSIRLSSCISTQIPSTPKILLFIAITGIAAIITRLVCPIGEVIFGLQLGYFPLYVAMYLIGIVAGRKGWLQQLSLDKAKPWFILALISIMVYVAIYWINYKYINQTSSRFNLMAVCYALWEPIMCVGFCYFIMALSKKYYNIPNRLTSQLSGVSFTAYIIHPFFVVGATLFTETICTNAYAGLSIAFVCGTFLCFCFAMLLRSIISSRMIHLS